MRPLRAGIVGCRTIARKRAAAAQSVSDIHLVGFYDHTLANAETLAQELGGGHASDDLPAMLDALDLDLLYICLPPFAHTDQVTLACERGIHFWIEKPIALALAATHSAAELTRCL
ncbi:MAG TPA: Gfo/Idh/MocA family oxidoreductase [Anaerolineae bacterium]|nr:Gfo/Idh/MocA family oxidoreductase [Anaerolineae bacterium]